MRFAIMTALVLIALAAPAHAETVRCQAGSWWFDNAKADVTVTIYEGQKLGEITVFGVTQFAACAVKGLEWRCDFGENFNYALVIRPGGLAAYRAAYYDFSNALPGESVKPSQFFTCK